MNFKHLNEQDLKTTFPKNGTISLNQMTDEQKEKYISLYCLYRKLFTEYIIQKLDLQKYEKEIEESGLNFLANKTEDMDIYQYFSSEILKYVYIRNNIYIEKLNDEEKAFLQKKIEENKQELDKEAEQFIEKTYQKLIFEDITKDNKLYIIQYGPDSRNFFAQNNSVVIGIRYDEFEYNGLDDETWDKLHDKQLIYLDSLIEKMKKELETKLPVPIAIIEYDQFSVNYR